jgi:sulfotransferase family protein
MSADVPPILVTGITRSGTTWVASMLNASRRVVYVNEPLNPKHPPGGSPGVLQAEVRARYQYICADNEREFLDAYRDLLALRYHLAAELRRNHRLTDIARAARYLALFTRGRVQGRRLMVADPFAVFSAEWFVRRLGFQVVVMLRHPVAVVGSRKRLGWRFDLPELLAQPLLVRDWLAPIQRGWPDALRPGGDIVQGGAQLWRLIYEAVLEQSRRLPGLILVRHEQLSMDPVGGFEELYERLGLPFDERARRSVIESTSTSNPAHLGKGAPHEIKLDSRANLDSWRSRLSSVEVDQVLEITRPVVDELYPDWPAGSTVSA